MEHLVCRQCNLYVEAYLSWHKDIARSNRLRKCQQCPEFWIARHDFKVVDLKVERADVGGLSILDQRTSTTLLFKCWSSYEVGLVVKRARVIVIVATAQDQSSTTGWYGRRWRAIFGWNEILKYQDLLGTLVPVTIRSGFAIRTWLRKALLMLDKHYFQPGKYLQKQEVRQ